MNLKTILQIGFILLICVLLTKQEKDNDDDSISNFVFKRGKIKRGKKKNKAPKVSNTPSNTGKPISKPPGLPDIYGADIDVMESTHPNKKFRSGEPTHTHSCDTVKSVPGSLRKSSVFYLPVHKFYSKYTEAYGIPVVGSKNVTDEGLKRACYLLRVMLGPRWDIRRSLYKFFVRVAMIGDGEEVTDLPEFGKMDARWNIRARGFGPTITKPIIAAGDDNQRCLTTDRYHSEDILLHEFAHGVEVLGARFLVPAFLKRLKQCYTKGVQQLGKWKDEYAAENKHELWAVASQFYFDQYNGNAYSKYGVENRATLAKYDPELYKLLREVYTCFDFRMIDRCHNKAKCSLKDNFRLVFPITVNARAQCKTVKSTYKQHTPEGCATFACEFGGNAFHFKTSSRESVCHLLDCASTSNAGLNLTQNKGQYFNIYARKEGVKTSIKTDSSLNNAKVASLCAFGPAAPSSGRCNINSKDRKPCGGSLGGDQLNCHKMGCCWENGNCFYGTQVSEIRDTSCIGCHSLVLKNHLKPADARVRSFFKDQLVDNFECADKSVFCSDFENRGECDRNPNFMTVHCPMSCGLCDKLTKMGAAYFKSKCQDKDLACTAWKGEGMCTGHKNSPFMQGRCPISCNSCNKFVPS